MRITSKPWITQVVAIVKLFTCSHFFFLKLRVFCDVSSFSTEVLLAWRTICQLTVNALAILTVTSHNHSLKLLVVQDFSSSCSMKSR